MPISLHCNFDFIICKHILNMKTQLFILIFSVFSLAIFANGITKFNETPKSIIVSTSEWKAPQVNVLIKENNGGTVYNEMLNTGKTDRKFNLKGMAKGTYTLEISDDLKITSQQFTITESDVVVDKTVNTIFKPVVVSKDNKIDVNLLNLSKNASIHIQDKYEGTIYSQQQNTSSVNKRFDISSLPSGSYSVNIDVDGRTYVHDFTK